MALVRAHRETHRLRLPALARIPSQLNLHRGWLVGFERGYHQNLITPTGEKAYVLEKDGMPQLPRTGRPKVIETYPKFNALVYSLETFVPLLKLGISERWTPNAKCGVTLNLGIAGSPTAGSLLRYYLWLHIIAGWVLTTLWVGGLSGFVKT